jgi:hypothetical protein
MQQQQQQQQRARSGCIKRRVSFAFFLSLHSALEKEGEEKEGE